MSGRGGRDRGSRLRELLARANPERAIDEELESHVAMRADQLVADGWSEGEARAEARRRFGDPRDVKAACARTDRRRARRAGRGEAWSALGRDLRLAVRTARRTPGPSLLAVLAIGLGTGITAAVFSVANGVLLRDLPYPDADRLVRVYAVDAGTGDRFGLFGPRELEALRRVEGIRLAAYSLIRRPLTGEGIEPGDRTFARVTEGFFGVLGRAPLVGRTPSPEEYREGRPVVVLGHDVWAGRFGADPNVVGRRVEIAARPHTIIGVMPARFEMPAEAALWRPLTSAEMEDEDRELHAIGRLADGVGLGRVSSALAARLTAFETERAVGPDERRAAWAGSAREALVRSVRGPLWLLLGAAGLVLLVACVNVSNLLLARAEARRDQAALRQALGAGRARLIRAHLVESLFLAAAGGGLGLLLGRAALPVLIRLAPAGTPRLAEVSLDGGVVLAMIGIVLATALFTGTVPAWRAAGTAPASLAAAGRRFGGGGARLLRGFVAAQIALSTALAVGAMLLGASFARLMSVDRGFDTADAVVLPLAPPDDTGRSDGGALGWYDRILSETRSLPGVRAAHLTFRAPDGGSGINLRAIQPEGLREDPAAGASVGAVTPGYFEAAGIAVLEGRGIAGTDHASAPPVAVVSRSFAQRLLPDGPRVGARFRHHATSDGEPVEVTVVGVVDDILPDPSAPPPPLLYVPFAQLPFGTMELVVRTAGPPGALLPALRERIRAIDPNVPLDAAYTLEEAVSRSVASPRFYMLVVGAFAALAVLLAAIGTYGVSAYGVAQRASEIGLRSALGADSRRILGQFVRQGLRPALLGIALGLGAAALLSRALAGLLFGIAPLEPWVYGAVALGLASVALCAVALPARHAARMDPLLALRHE